MLFRHHPDLLIAFRDGQHAALERVYREYVGAVERYLRALARRSGRADLGQADAVADLVQDVFVRAFSANARRSYDGLREYGPYLTRIARNCFVDVLRAGGREISADAEDVLFDEPAPDPFDYFEPRVVAVLTTFLAQLPASLQAVCEQRFVTGLSQEEVSASLGLSRREVRTAEHRLRRGLHKALARAGVPLGELSLRQEEISTRNRGKTVTGKGSP